MGENLLEEGIDSVDTRESEADKKYIEYQKRGGIINRGDYENALRRNEETITASEARKTQVEAIAEVAGIKLQDDKEGIDPRIKLYGVLRGDNMPEDVKYHHVQMTDPRLFAEVLRITGDTESLEKLILAYPNISFD